jgi:hypothetical protein
LNCCCGAQAQACPANTHHFIAKSETALRDRSAERSCSEFGLPRANHRNSANLIVISATSAASLAFEKSRKTPDYCRPAIEVRAGSIAACSAQRNSRSAKRPSI